MSPKKPKRKPAAKPKRKPKTHAEAAAIIAEPIIRVEPETPRRGLLAAILAWFD